MHRGCAETTDLLIEISARLKASLREVDTIARLGGDEFAVIVPGCEDEKSIADLCERLIETLVKPLVVDRIEHTVGASIGIALFPRSLEDVVIVVEVTGGAALEGALVRGQLAVVLAATVEGARELLGSDRQG